jgi:HEAT repeat protein
MLLAGTAFFWTLGQFAKSSPGPAAAVAAPPLDIYLAALDAEETDAARIEAIEGLAEIGGDPRIVPALVGLLESTDSEAVVETLVETLGALGDPAAVTALEAAGARDFDPFLKLSIATSLVDLGSPAGDRLLLAILEDPDAGFARAQAAELLESRAGESFGFDMLGSGEANAAALARIEAWIDAQDP